MKLVYFKILDQFSLSSFEIHEFSSFNQILLSLFDISSVFHNSIWLNIKASKNMSNSINNSNTIFWNVYETSNKPNKILLKKLNLRILKDEWLN